MLSWLPLPFPPVRRRPAPVVALLLGVLLGAVLVGPAAPAAAADPAPRRIVNGWIRPAPHLSAALASVRANKDLWSDVSPFWFSVTGATSISGRADPAVVSELKSLGLTVLPTVTETLDTAAMSAMLGDATQRARHRDAIVALVTNNAFSGIDLDYESMNFGGTAAQKKQLAARFVTFLTELNAALDAKGKLLSVTVGPRRSTTDANWAVHDYAGIGKVVDRFRIMTYDYSWQGGPAGPIAPLGWTDQVIAYAVTVVPRSKVEVGVPLYGYDWPRKADGTWGRATSLSTYRDVEALRKARGAARKWSATHAAPYFTYTSGGVAHTVWYNDSASTAAKMRLVEKHGIRGMAFWHVANEDARQWSQIRSYATPSRSSLTSSAASAVVYGARTAVSGVLRDAAGKALLNVKVRLQRRNVGSTAWTSVVTGRTSASGTVSLTHQPTVSSEVRLVSASGWGYTAGTSPVRRTLVRWKATAALNATSIPNLTTVVLRGSVAPAAKGILVRRQLRVDGVWTTMQETRTRADGSYAFSWRMSAKKGAYSYRTLVPAASGRAQAASPVRILTVR